MARKLIRLPDGSCLLFGTEFHMGGITIAEVKHTSQAHHPWVDVMRYTTLRLSVL